MSLFVLDTDTLSLHYHGHPIVQSKVTACKPDELAVTVITVEEQLSGWYSLLRTFKKRDELARTYAQLGNAVKALGQWAILPYTEAAMLRYDHLKSLKLNVKSQDLRIAAIALEHSAVVVTRNVRDFQRVPGLVIEDWTV
jgi:tRNA(fMet)-specific endonuclease VapC